jgi:hypothetical protein
MLQVDYKTIRHSSYLNWFSRASRHSKVFSPPWKWFFTSAEMPHGGGEVPKLAIQFHFYESNQSFLKSASLPLLAGLRVPLLRVCQTAYIETTPETDSFPIGEHESLAAIGVDTE